MAAANGSALALAAHLRSLDDGELARVIRTREFRRSGIRDYFDLAEALLDPTSLQAALGRLDRLTLAALSVAGETAPSPATVQALADALDTTTNELRPRLVHAAQLGLVGLSGDEVIPWEAVSAQLRSWPSLGLPSRDELVARRSEAPASAPDSIDQGRVDRGAAERSFATVTAVTELCLALAAASARVLARGGLAVPDARRLAAVAGTDVDAVDPLLVMGQQAGLLHMTGREWQATPRAEEWASLARMERWSDLATAWLASLDPVVRSLLEEHAADPWGPALAEELHWRYPAGESWTIPNLTRALDQADALGIAHRAQPSTVGTTLLARGVDAARAVLAPLFPAEIDRVYLQNDLSIVAPGPLVPAIDARLRRFAIAETRGPASTYRVTADGITRALVAGETEESLLAFLASISLDRVPQPLDYLVRDTAGRFGTLRVGPLPAGSGAQASLHVSDPRLVDELLVDPRLAILALTRDPEPTPDGATRLLTRLSRDVTYWALSDARYAVVAEDENGTIVDLDRPVRATVTTQETDPVADLVASLRSVGEQATTEQDSDWILRQLELAVRNRIPVIVRVRMPDGSEPELLVEPASISGGRLRARDRRSDLERTLPVSYIVAVTAAE